MSRKPTNQKNVEPQTTTHELDGWLLGCMLQMCVVGYSLAQIVHRSGGVFISDLYPAAIAIFYLIEIIFFTIASNRARTPSQDALTLLASLHFLVGALSLLVAAVPALIEPSIVDAVAKLESSIYKIAVAGASLFQAARHLNFIQKGKA